MRWKSVALWGFFRSWNTPNAEVISNLSAREAELGLVKGALLPESRSSHFRAWPSTLTSNTGFNSLSTGARRATRFTRTAPSSKPSTRPTGPVKEQSTGQRSCEILESAEGRA